MNRILKEATAKRYPYDSHAALREHLTLFVQAYNYGCRLKTLRGLTPYELNTSVASGNVSLSALD